jgi:hypothetical protein
LVIPEATLNGQASTNTSQVDGGTGTIETMTVGGFDVIHLDGADVYGRRDRSLGWLDAFDRWLVRLPDGHFLIVDAFQVRDDRPESHVQEYWYAFDRVEVPDRSTCRHQTQHTSVSLSSSNSLLLQPICAGLDNGPAEVVATIAAASAAGGSFVIDPPVAFSNRLNSPERRARARYVPSAALRSDVRLFVLVSALESEGLPAVSATARSVGDEVVFDVGIGTDNYQVRVHSSTLPFVLEDIVGP